MSLKWNLSHSIRIIHIILQYIRIYTVVKLCSWLSFAAAVWWRHCAVSYQQREWRFVHRTFMPQSILPWKIGGNALPWSLWISCDTFLASHPPWNIFPVERDTWSSATRIENFWRFSQAREITLKETEIVCVMARNFRQRYLGCSKKTFNGSCGTRAEEWPHHQSSM